MSASQHDDMPDLQAQLGTRVDLHISSVASTEDIDDEIRARFLGVENSPPATDEQKRAVAAIRTATLILAHTIQKNSTHPRYKATALTNLETAAMFAVKGVFQTDAFVTKDNR